MIYDTVIVGGGICGLTAAYSLSSGDSSVLLLESGTEVGGMIKTVHSDGYMVEGGPTTFLGSAEAIWSLCESLGIEPVATSERAKSRYIFLKGKLHKVPMSPLALVSSPILSAGAKCRLLMEPWQPTAKVDDETVASFTRRRLGPEVLDHLLSPFISGVYAGNAEDLSIAALFPKLVEWEKSSGSIIRGILSSFKKIEKKQGKSPKQSHGIFSFKDGLKQLPSALANALPDDYIRLNSPVQSIHMDGDCFKLILPKNKAVMARTLLMATPAKITASLIQSLNPEVAAILRDIPYVPLAVVHLGFPEKVINQPLDGFGFLVSNVSEDMPLLGTIWMSSLFPDRAADGHILLSSYLGGALHPEVAYMSDSELIMHTLKSLQKVFRQQTLEPAFSKLFRYEYSIPQYNLGHLELISRLERHIGTTPGLFLTGNYLRGVSLNDCIKAGTKVSERIQIYSNELTKVCL